MSSLRLVGKGYLLQTWSLRYRQALIAAGRGDYDAADALTAEMLR
ncbi:MAG: hypothetical protein ACLPKI_08430 [Streptosporangiaceae bacterium]